jgi:hypothetical protein
MYVYFIQDPQSKHVKIGKARNVRKRLEALKCAHSSTLVLLGATADYTEQLLHQRFASCRIRGEWFNLSPELKVFISELFPHAQVCSRGDLIKAGMERAKRNGMKPGPPAFNIDMEAVKQRHYTLGESLRSIARSMNVSPALLVKRLKSA